MEDSVLILGGIRIVIHVAMVGKARFATFPRKILFVLLHAAIMEHALVQILALVILDTLLLPAILFHVFLVFEHAVTEEYGEMGLVNRVILAGKVTGVRFPRKVMLVLLHAPQMMYALFHLRSKLME